MATEKFVVKAKDIEQLNSGLSPDRTSALVEESERPKFVVKAKNMGSGLINDFTSASELIEFLEGPEHR